MLSPEDLDETGTALTPMELILYSERQAINNKMTSCQVVLRVWKYRYALGHSRAALSSTAATSPVRSQVSEMEFLRLRGRIAGAHWAPGAGGCCAGSTERMCQFRRKPPGSAGLERDQEEGC